MILDLAIPENLEDSFPSESNITNVGVDLILYFIILSLFSESLTSISIKST